MPFTPIGNGKYKSPSGRTFTSKQVKMYYATNGFNKNKAAFKRKQRKVDNKMRSYGDFDERTGKIRINKKLSAKERKRKGNYPELADTIYHEELHKQKPKLTEKQVYKKTRLAMKRLSTKQKKKLYSKYANR